MAVIVEFLVCPDCSEALRPQAIGHASAEELGPYRSSAVGPNACEINRCPGCKGVWFDGDELVRTLRAAVPEGVEVEETQALEQQRVERGAGVSCLRCGAAMDLVRSRAAPWLIYDRCPGCASAWVRGRALEQLEDPLVVVLSLASGEFLR